MKIVKMLRNAELNGVRYAKSHSYGLADEIADQLIAEHRGYEVRVGRQEEAAEKPPAEKPAPKKKAEKK